MATKRISPPNTGKITPDKNGLGIMEFFAKELGVATVEGN